MVLVATVVAMSFSSAFAGSDIITGAGATFPYPVYSQWAYKYGEIKGVKLNYQSIGSGGGIAQIKAKTVDFGASDAPMEPRELDELGMLQFPMVMGGVVPVVKIKGVASGSLKLTPELLAAIFMGKVKKWNDPAIAKVNPGLALPNQAITVVHRADGSGTTWIFTSYLAAVSPGWKKSVGAGKAVAWPAGVGGKGNEGVSAYVERVNGSIGYVEYAYALQNKMDHALLKNRAGSFVAPSIKSFQAAAEGADWKNAKGFYMELVDQPGKDTWPITGASFILMYKDQKDAAHSKAVLSFFDWCFNHGAEMAEKLDYVPMPASVVKLVQAKWKADMKAGGKPVWK
jgi:phosphate transport system substrate-binding protein